jgi:autotransporter-associated beta strand protein
MKSRSLFPIIPFSVGVLAISPAHAAISLLEWNTVGNAGTETTEPSILNATNITAAPLTLGSLTAAANTNRFGGSNWFNTGNTAAGNTLAEAVAGNDYIQFVVTPGTGYSFSTTDFRFIWDRSGTGPSSLVLRSSADSFAANLGTVTGTVSGNQTTVNTMTFSLTGLASATTFRLYGFGATGTGGTGGFDTVTGATTPNVILSGDVLANTFWDTNGSTAGSGNAGGNWSSASWNAIATGTGGTGSFANGQTATFAAGTDGTGAYTVNVNTAASVSGLVFQEGTVTLANAPGGSLTMTGPGVDVASGAVAKISQAVGGSAGLTKTGAGSLELSGANGYSGATTLSAGSLSLGASNVLPTTQVVMNGGTLLTNGNTDTVGTLSLTSSSVINLAGAGSLSFANSSAVTWTAATVLNVWNWTQGGLTFGSDNTGLTLGQVGKINVFEGGSGSNQLLYLSLDNTGTLVAVPEARAVFGVLALLAPLAYRERRHWMRCREARIC